MHLTERVFGFLLFLLPVCCIAQGRGYSEVYASECRDALSFRTKHKADFEAVSDRAGVSADFLFAVVAPEISQYGSLTDKAQTYALKTLYVRMGKGYADFSIGWFQMKPSFVEQLERYIQEADTLLTSFPEVQMAGKEGRSARIERVRRLEQQDWQMKYLALFCRVVQHRFRRMKFESEQEKLRFYANAYNAGFMLDGERLRRYKGAYFPHLAKQKFRYADVSLWFYENIPSEDSL